MWWPQSRGDRSTIRFFEEVDPEAMAMAGEEARALGEFLEGETPDIVISLDGEAANGDAEVPQRIPLGALPLQ